MTAESTTPERLWSRVDAAVVAVEAAQAESAAQELRSRLALALANALVDDDVLVASIAEYAAARVAHVASQADARAAQDELRASRGIDVWSVA